jgi:hypothetical protein
MATRTTIFWGVWDCSECGTKGISAEPKPGERNAVCNNCGAPRNIETRKGEEEAYISNKIASNGKVVNPNVADTKEEVELALGGPDWNCNYCNSGNSNLLSKCNVCGANRYDEHVSSDDEVYDHEDVSERKSDNSVMPPVPVEASNIFDNTSEQEYIPSNNFGKNVAIAIFALFGFFAFFAFLYAMFTTSSVDAKVTSMSWSRSVQSYNWTLTSDSDWADNISNYGPIHPVNGRGERAGEFDIRNCHRKHYDDRKYACGTEEECHEQSYQVADGESCSTTSLGNGAFKETCHDVYKTKYKTVCDTVTKYCTEPIYKQWCNYSTYKWVADEIFRASGTDKNVYYPSYTPQELKKYHHFETFEIYTTYSGNKKYSFNAADESSYKSYNIGQNIKLEENLFGIIMSHKP